MTEAGFENMTWYKWIGQRVCIKGINYGTLRYFGEIIYNDGLWCGIELDEPLGETNGISNNVRYFSCKDNYGIFVPPYEVTKLNKDETNTELCLKSNITKESNDNYFASNSAACEAKDFITKPCKITEEFKNNDSSCNSNVDLNKTFDIFKRLEPKQLSDIAEISLEELNKCESNCINEKESFFKRKPEREIVDRLDSEESLGIISDLLTDDMTFDLCKVALDSSDKNLNNKIVHNLEDDSLLVFSPPNNNICKMNLFLKNINSPLPYFENEHRISSTPKPSLNSQCDVKDTNTIEHDLLNLLQDEKDVDPIIAGSNQTKFKIDFDVDEFKNSHPLSSTSKAFSPTQLISSLLLNERFNMKSEGENSMLQEVFETKEENRTLNVTQTLSDGDIKNIDRNRSISSIQNCPDHLNCTFNIKSSASLESPASLADDSILSSMKNVSLSIDDKLEKNRALNSTFVLKEDKVKCISDCERTFIINHSPTQVTDANSSLNLGEDIRSITFCEKSNCKNKTYDKIDLLQSDNNHAIEVMPSMHQKEILNVASENSDNLKVCYEIGLSYFHEDSLDKIESVALSLAENTSVKNKSSSDKFSDEAEKHQGVKFSENSRNETGGQHNSEKRKTHETITNDSFPEHFNDEIRISLSDDFSNDLKTQKSAVSSTLIEKALFKIQVFKNDSSKKLEIQKVITNGALSKNTNGEILLHSANDFSDVITQQASTETSFVEHESDNIRTNEETNLILCPNDPSDEIECLKSQAQIKNIFLGKSEAGVKTNKINLNQNGIVSVDETSLKFSETVKNTISKRTQTKTQYQHDSNLNGEPCDETKITKSQTTKNSFSEKDGRKDKSLSKTHSLDSDVRNKSLAKPSKIICPKRGTSEISRLPVNRSNISKSKIENKVEASEFNSTFSTSSGHQKQSSSISSESKRLSLPLVSSVKVPNISKHTTEFKKPLQTSCKISVNKLVPEFKIPIKGKKSNMSSINAQDTSKPFSHSVYFTNVKNTEKVAKNAGTIVKKVLKSTERNIPKPKNKTSLKVKYSELKSDPKIACSIQRCDEIMDSCKVAGFPEKNSVLSQTEINEKNSEKINEDYNVISNLPIKTLSKDIHNNNNCISKPVIKEKDMPIPKVCQLDPSQNAVNEKIFKNIVKPRYSLLPNVKLFSKSISPEENGKESTCSNMPSFVKRKSVISKNLSNESDVPANKVTQFFNKINTCVEKQKENIRTSSQNSRLPVSNKITKNTNLADIKNNFNRRSSLLPSSIKPKGFSSSIARPNEAQTVPNSKNSQIQDSQRMTRKLPQFQKLQGTRSYCKKS